MKNQADLWKNSALLTDLYELTMMQGYFSAGLNPPVVFDMFFRRQPFNGGFAIFAGLETLLKDLEKLHFSGQDLKYLESLGLFTEDFLDYLQGFGFKGDIYAMSEGIVVFPHEPLIRVHGSLIQVQLIESLLLNTINFQTLIATKAARIFLAAMQGIVLEFGLRRAQGKDGAISAARAAFIGGASATSNTLAGKILDIPVKGTMAHSWVMAFSDEKEAFIKYAQIFPHNCILLIDTYDTLESGIKNAIIVGRKLKAQGINKFGVRLDSGDLEYLSKQVRKELDKAGLVKAKIAASNELTEEIIAQLISRKAPIDIWGVGTNLVSATGDPALSGVFKLVAKKQGKDYVSAIKVSNNPEKTTNPGIKQVYRFYDKTDSPLADLLALEQEHLEQGKVYRFFHPFYEYKFSDIKKYKHFEPLLNCKMRKGRIITELPSLNQIRENTISGLQKLDDTYKRLINPHIYKVSLSEKLRDQKFSMIAACK